MIELLVIQAVLLGFQAGPISIEFLTARFFIDTTVADLLPFALNEWPSAVLEVLFA